MKREEAINEIKSWAIPSEKGREVLETLIPELAESEDERTRKWLLDYAIEMIAGLESDISLSNYDGIKGHDPEAEAELAQWQKARAYLEKQKDLDKMIVVSPEVWDKAINDAYENGKKDGEKQKEPHYTKRNALFDKCVENCDPEVMKRVSDEVDEMLEKEQKPADDKAFEEWVDDWWKHNKVNNPDSYDKGDEIQFDELGFKNFCRGIRNMYQQEPSWSEEDEKMRNALWNLLKIQYAQDHSMTGVGIEAGKFRDWLKSLPLKLKKKNEDVAKLCSNEWSEEDEEKLKAICTYLQDYSRLAKLGDKLRFNEYCDFLKSLRPQPHWKPSEEQMKALEDAFRKDGSDEYRKTINSLYQQLKRL